MKKGLKAVIIILIIFTIITISIYLTIFILAKQKKIFINKWFVDEKIVQLGLTFHHIKPI